MDKKVSSNNLIIPVYINEKIVLDMLAIVEDGFSTVSQVNYTMQKESTNGEKAGVSVSTSATLLSKLLKLDVSGNVDHSGKKGETENIIREKIHTNASLLSKFRSMLIENKAIKTNSNIKDIQVGDFIEVSGQLEKNPLVNYLELFVDFIKLANNLSDEPELGTKKQANAQKSSNYKIIKQIETFRSELIQSGTIDFVLSDSNGTVVFQMQSNPKFCVVLSAQEQYLENDNISEIIGGRFRVLGKVISVCPDESESIDLLRKSSLSVVSEGLLNKMFSGLNNDETKQFDLPELRTRIPGPALIVIPIAIFA